MALAQSARTGSSNSVQPAHRSFSAQALCTSGQTASKISCSYPPMDLRFQGLGSSGAEGTIQAVIQHVLAPLSNAVAGSTHGSRSLYTGGRCIAERFADLSW